MRLGTLSMLHVRYFFYTQVNFLLHIGNIEHIG